MNGNQTQGFANMQGHTDVYPYEVVRVVSDKCVVVRPMQAVQDPAWVADIVPGGFAAHYTNQDAQRWIITADPTADTMRLRLGNKGWRDAYGRKFALATEPCKYYDFNF